MSRQGSWGFPDFLELRTPGYAGLTARESTITGHSHVLFVLSGFPQHNSCNLIL